MADLGLLSSVGTGQSSKPTRFSPISTQHFFSGLVTNRSPFNDNDPRYQKRFLGGRPDSLIDGLNCELSIRGTYIRRPGFTPYSSATLPGGAISFYSFHLFSPSLVNPIKVIADSPVDVRYITSTTATFLWAKQPSAGQSYFQSVGNALYWGDGVSQKQWIQSSTVWTPNTTYTAGGTVLIPNTGGTPLPTGTWIVDPNANIQQVVQIYLAIGSLGIVNNVLSLYSLTPLSADQISSLPGQAGVMVNFVTATYLNNKGASIISAANVYNGSVFFHSVLTLSFAHADVGTFADTGSIILRVGSGVSGGVQPTWNTNQFGNTTDGTLIWNNRGFSVRDWGIAAPTVAPVVANTTGAAVIPSWTATTFYSPSLILLDSNNNIQLLTTAGTTGGGAPVWNVTPGGTTADNTAVWTNQGSGIRTNNHAYTQGAYISAFFSIQIPIYGFESDLPTGARAQRTIVGYSTVNYFDFFVAQNSGTSANAAPTWSSGFGTTVTDGGVTWQNIGTVITWPGGTQHSVATIAVGAAKVVVLTQQILDSNGNLQNVYFAGTSQAAHPTWATKAGALSNESSGTLQWQNGGPAPSTANTAVFVYAYAYKNSITGHVGTVSPLSQPILLSPPSGFSGYITVSGPSDPNSATDGADTVEIYRTSQGGSTNILQFLADTPLPPVGFQWQFQDAVLDSGLNPFILGATNHANDPPPVGLGKLTYHLNRVWGAVQNVVYFSAGPDATIGNGSEAWPPANNFVFPDTVNRLVKISSGLLVFTTDEVFIILGTSIATFYPMSFQEGVGLSSYNALDIQGSNIFLYTTDKQFVSISSSGINWLGANIADTLEEGFDPTKVYVASLISGTDQGVYIMDGTGTSYRCNWNQPPEGGPAWSPQAVITNGATCMNTVKTAPGRYQLLIGQSNGNVLFRDVNTFSDNGTPYFGYITLGSLVFAQPGQIAEIESVSVELFNTSATPTVSVLPEEIDPSLFEVLTNWAYDPVTLSPSQSYLSQRFYLSQAGDATMLRHMQIKIAIGAATTADEIATVSVFGALESKEQ